MMPSRPVIKHRARVQRTVINNRSSKSWASHRNSTGVTRFPLYRSEREWIKPFQGKKWECYSLWNFSSTSVAIFGLFVTQTFAVPRSFCRCEPRVFRALWQPASFAACQSTRL